MPENSERHPRLDTGFESAAALQQPERMFGPMESVDDIFLAITDELRSYFSLNRGLLVMRDEESTRFVATASFSERTTRTHLCLRIPTNESLFSHVADGGITYTDNCPQVFSGNAYERNLLIDGDTESYILVPLKHQGEVVGLVGYSSDYPMAFAALEDGGLEPVAEFLASRIAREQAVTQTA